MDDAEHPSPRIDWRTAVVDGRRTHFAVGGSGPPVLFLHGWGMTHRAYLRPLSHLTRNHVRVFAPALPGFGGTEDLPTAQRSLGGYAHWLWHFRKVAEVPTPITVVGHSFGGGVAIQACHDFPALASQLVLVNSIGGSKWTDARGAIKASKERPLWDWGLHLQADLTMSREATRVLPVVARESLPNVLRNPRAFWRVAHLARTADLEAELAVLRERRLPIVIVWSKRDTVIPESTLISLRTGLGDPELITVPGGHSWLISDPSRFGEVITNIVSATREAEDEGNPSG